MKHFLKRLAYSLGFLFALAGIAQAAVLTAQTTTFAGLNYTSASASTADSFTNDGDTILLFTNANASSRTLTIAANTANRPGFGAIATPSTVITLPGSGTNGGLAVAGPFPTERFNDGFGKVNYTLDVATSMSVAVIKLTQYQ